MSVRKLEGEQKERRVRRKMSRPPLVCVISDDNGLRTRASSLLHYNDDDHLYGARVKIVRGGVSFAAAHMFDNMYNIATDAQKQRLLSVFYAASQDIRISQRVGNAANVVSKKLKRKDPLTPEHVEIFLQLFTDIPLIMPTHNLHDVWKRMTPDDIPDIPVLPDGSIRIAGCAGTERLCAVLHKLIQQIDNGLNPDLIIVGRHGLSTKSYRNEFKPDNNPRFPDHGHNVKIHGEEGHEAHYFELLEALKMRCGAKFHHLTTNSFFTDENNNGVAGTRLSGLELMENGAPVLKIYGNEEKYSRDPQSIISIRPTRVLDNILTTLCFTPNHATFLHDLKLCWILSNYETVEEFFKPQYCHLWCGMGKDGTDMLFRQDSPREEYFRVRNLFDKANIITVQDNFLTTHRDSWTVNEAFHMAANDGIRNLQISALVTDPGPGHIAKAQKGYFPLGPQDGDDLLAIEAIVGSEGVQISYAGEMKTGTRLRY